MARKLLVWLLILLLPAAASAEDIVYYTPKPNGNAPYETVAIAPDGMFASADGLLTIDFIDRGAADCILLQCGGESLLVDGGKYGLYAHLKDVFSYLGLTHFTYMLNTHTHDDHIEGLIKLLRHGYTADEYMSCYPDDYRGSDYQTTVRELLKQNNIPYHRIGDGDTFTLGDAQITVFRDETPHIDKNRHSIVLKVVYGERSALLMADAIGRTQNYFLEHYDASVFKADVLKYPHHGYVNMTAAFLSTVDPAVCVITNTRKAADLADKQLAYHGIPRFYTNEGNVRMQTDGHMWHAQQMMWDWPLDVVNSNAL